MIRQAKLNALLAELAATPDKWVSVSKREMDMIYEESPFSGISGQTIRANTWLDADGGRWAKHYEQPKSTCRPFTAAESKAWKRSHRWWNR